MISPPSPLPLRLCFCENCSVFCNSSIQLKIITLNFIFRCKRRVSDLWDSRQKKSRICDWFVPLLVTRENFSRRLLETFLIVLAHMLALLLAWAGIYIKQYLNTRSFQKFLFPHWIKIRWMHVARRESIASSNWIKLDG